MIAVMQPYLFPYLGYYQLVSCTDVFVVYDDVNYIKGGYINRNSILVCGKSQRFTVPVPNASSNKKIKELHFTENNGKILKTIAQAYSKAPHFKAVYPIIDRVFNDTDKTIAGMCGNSIQSVFNYLGLDKKIVLSSGLDYERSNVAADRLIEMVRLFNDRNYVNSIGGQELYSKEYFQKSGVVIQFLKMKQIKYEQGDQDFIPNLSIIDVLMWCDKEKIIEMLDEYELV